MSNREHLKRRDAFICDVVSVCKKHRVMISPDGSDFDSLNANDISFNECNHISPRGFYVTLADLEDAVRLAVWPVVNPDAVSLGGLNHEECE